MGASLYNYYTEYRQYSQQKYSVICKYILETIFMTVKEKTVKNRLKHLIDSLGETRYQFWKKTGLSQNTAYRLYDEPEYIPGRDVIEKICRVYGWQPGDFIVYAD